MKKWLLAVSFAYVGAAGAAAAPPAESSRQLRGVFNKVALKYTANVERIAVSDPQAGGAAAELVTFSYVADAPAGAQRPVIFIFNGGPIGPSIFLHMLAMGPRRLAVPDDLAADPAGFKLADNPYALLDVADLVFFDPATTGYSRVAGATKPDAYFSVDADARQLTQFVQQWSARHGRAASPKYLFGESYGTIRAAVAARQLSELPESQNLRGVFLMGQALNIVETVYRPSNIVSYVASLPTLAATGWHFGKVDKRGRGFEQFLDEVRLFARTDYLVALYQGSALDPARERELAAKLAGYTGLGADVFLSSHLRVSKPQYRNLLLKAEGKVLGANDARYAGPAANGDPANGIIPAVYGAFQRYAHDTLGVAAGAEYLTESPVVPDGLESWRWGATTPFSNWPYMDQLGAAMKRNPALKVAIGVGYQDTLTTVGASEYAVNQSGWPGERVGMHYYDGGHMAYTIESSLKKLSDDMRGLISGAGHVQP